MREDCREVREKIDVFVQGAPRAYAGGLSAGLGRECAKDGRARPALLGLA